MPDRIADLPFFLLITIVALEYRRTYRPHCSDQTCSPNSGRMISHSCHSARTNRCPASAPIGWTSSSAKNLTTRSARGSQ